MRLLAPAKVNLHLRVGPADPSGFHPLMSWMCAVGLFDTLTIEPNDSGVVTLTCDDPSLPCDESNLVVRAARSLDVTGVAIRLEKRIPMGAGLGGGSSDAARTLLALNRLFDRRRSLPELGTLAISLGSDVPFFLHGRSCICTGRGEHVVPAPPPRPKFALLVLPDIHMPTPAVYRKFDELRLGDRDSITSQPSWTQWAELSAGPLLRLLVNDLEPPAFALCPRLANLRNDLEQSLGRIVRMSGSGSSLFTLFDELPAANAAVERIQDRQKVRAVAVELAPTINDDLIDA